MRKLMGFLVGTVLMAMLVPPMALAAEAPTAQEPEVLQGIAGLDAALCKENPKPIFRNDDPACYRCTGASDCSSFCPAGQTGVCTGFRGLCIDELGPYHTVCRCS
jgi:hypothetical protein